MTIVRTATLQFECEAKSVFDPGHRGSGQLAQFSFEPRGSNW